MPRSRQQKRTFSLHASAIRALDEMVAAGFASSKNTMVERAIWQQFQEFRRYRRAEGWKAAASDALFLRDIAEVEQQFRTADREPLG